MDGGLLELYTDMDDLWQALVECIRLDMRRTQHRKKFGAGAGTFGFSFDALNVVFEMRGPDRCQVSKRRGLHQKLHGYSLLESLADAAECLLPPPPPPGAGSSYAPHASIPAASDSA